MRKFGTSLKFKVSLIIFLTNIVFAIICCLIYFFLYRQSIQEYLTETATVSANNLCSDIEKQILDIDRFSTWCVLNESFQAVLKLPSISEAKEKKQQLDAQKDLISKLTTIESYPYIIKVLLVGKNGVSFQTGTRYSGRYPVDNTQSDQWYKRVTETSLFSIRYDGAQNDDSGGVFFPAGRKMLGISDASQTGSVYFEISDKLFADASRKYRSPPLSVIQILDKGRLIYSTDPYYFGEAVDIPQEPVRKNGTLFIPVNVYSAYAGLTVQLFVPFQNSRFQRNFITSIIIFSLFLNIIAAATIYLVFVRNFTKKINRIYDRVRSIAQNDFSRDNLIEGQDELGYIGREINRMSAAIENMMVSSINTEQEKKVLELEALQQQINPHFLYNTLNSIKWMAEIQGSEGIVEIVTALSRLLRAIAANTAEKISLAEELQLVRDYCTIQKIRYKGKFSLKINAGGFENYQILKFTLQPLVENAIFHGLEPKTGKGLIEIHVFKKDTLIIEVCDNGIGMDEEKLKRLLTEEPPKESSRLNNIGLANVHRRLKLVYGEIYGLTVESTAGKGTCVRLSIPVQEVQ